MIALDTSVALAILLNETDGPALSRAIAEAPRPAMSAVTWLELGMVLRGRIGPEGPIAADQFAATIALDIVPFDRAQADIALEAFRIYGKGIHPKARLNFGDCASYALAKSRNIPLLFKGDDFTHTDVLTVVSST
jgi:ribonuclease VapC